MFTAILQINTSQPLALKGSYLFVLQAIHKLLPLNQQSLSVDIRINEKTSHWFEASSMRVRGLIGETMKFYRDMNRNRASTN